MLDDREDAFIRWQGITLQQFSFVNNLLIGLSTGILAFQLNISFNSDIVFDTWSKCLFLSSVVVIFISLALGCLTAWNRLVDFRTTKVVARKRENKEPEGIEELRRKYTVLGKRSWSFLKLQLIFFGFGSLFILGLVILRVAG